jgi:hypothetical protein
MLCVNTYTKYRFWGWLLLLPLLLGSSICLLKYAGWSAVVSGRYGLPSDAELVRTAQHAGTIDLWVLIGLTLIAVTIVLSILPPICEGFSPGLKGIARFLIAIGVVLLGNVGGGYLLIALGRHLK